MLTKDTIKTIHADLTEALRMVAEKHNLSVGRTHITYDSDGFKLTGQFGDKSQMGEVNPTYFNDMKRYGRVYGFTTDDISKEVTMGARIYVIQGMKGRSLIGKNKSDEKLYKLDPLLVKQVMKS